MSRLEPDELRIWLEWAGGKLLTLHVGRIKPRESGCLWPDTKSDPDDGSDSYLREQSITPLRLPPPAAYEIPYVDAILLLPNLSDRISTRRVLHSRSLISPITGRCIFPWTKIARLVNSDRRTVRKWWVDGLREVARKVDDEKVFRFRTFFSLDTSTQK